MPRWLRFLVCALALAAFVAGGGAAAAKAMPCDGMDVAMNMDDCAGSQSHDSKAVPACAALVCGTAQTVLPPVALFSCRIVLTLAAPLAPGDDLEPNGCSGPPDLRPPIA